MVLKIYWTDFAKQELQGIFDYYKHRAGLNIARKLVSGISEVVLSLSTQPNVGQKEELLANRFEEFRYLVYKNYKIIYWINSEQRRVEIVDVFDTRQNPVKMKRSEKI